MEGNQLKMSPEVTVSGLAMLIYKAVRQSGASSGDAGGADQDEEGADETVYHSKTDLVTIMETDFGLDEKERKRLSYRSSRSGSFKVMDSLYRIVTPGDKHAKLLFGATGLVGSHILRYLLKGGAPMVYCVVRAATPEGAYNRVEQKMRQLRLWKPAFANRIRAIPGEVGKALFGLDAELYQQLLSVVDDVILSAGARSWTATEETIAANIAGTVNAVAFARKGGAAVHYVSTGWLDIYDAADATDKKTFENVPYVKIKRRAEDILHYASRHHDIRCAIHRVPFVSVNSKGGFDGDLLPFTVMALAKVTGMAAREWQHGYYPLLPADAAAKFIVRGVEKGPKGSTSKGAEMRTALTITSFVSESVFLDWVDEIRSSPIDRNHTPAEVIAAVEQVLGQDTSALTLLMELGDAVNRVSAALHHKMTTQRPSVRDMMEVRHRSNPKVTADLIKQYIAQNPTVIDLSTALVAGPDDDSLESKRLSRQPTDSDEDTDERSLTASSQ